MCLICLEKHSWEVEAVGFLSPCGLSGGPAATAEHHTAAGRFAGAKNLAECLVDAWCLEPLLWTSTQLKDSGGGTSKISIVISSCELIKGSCVPSARFCTPPTSAVLVVFPGRKVANPCTEQHHSHGNVVYILYIHYSQDHHGNPGNHYQAICRGQVL